MAAIDPDELLSSTREKNNFQRVARLLISGGTALLREIFDQLCPPSNLPSKLKNPVTRTQLRAAKLTKPQWDCLYPSSGVSCKSADFDITLLFRLLRTICSLTPPTTGWDAPPNCADYSLAADLVRIKYFRNSVYGHVSQNMEITDDKFPQLWQDISEALLRIAGVIIPGKKIAWQEAIDNFLKDPLTAEDELNVQELLRWYRNDVEVKEYIEGLLVELKTTSQEVQCLVQDEAQEIKNQLGGELKNTGEEVQSIVREKAQDIKNLLGGELKTTSQGVQCLEKVVREESQDIKDQLGDRLERELKTTSQDVQSAVQEEAQNIKNQLRGELKTTGLDVQNIVREEAQGIKNQLGGELKTTSQGVQCLEKVVREESQDIKDQLGDQLERELKTTSQRVQCLEKVVREESQDIKDQLGEMHQSIGRLSSSADGPQAGRGQFKITQLLFTKVLIC